MPTQFAESLFWNLPHEVRRVLFRARHPSSYNRLQKLRTETEGDYSLRPFIDHKCVFVHIPKCAGSSISRSLFGNLGGGHTTARKYQIVFTKKEFAEYFKFAFVRNPWDRVVSAFLFLKKGGTGQTDQRWAEQNLSEYPDFDSFVRGWLNPVNARASWHFKPQYPYVSGRDGRLLIDFVGYFERLQEDYSFIRRTIRCGAPLIHLNQTRDRSKDFRQYYREETQQIVADVYREDIRIFGYGFESEAPTGPLHVNSPETRQHSLPTTDRFVPGR
jgi:hypothetical protein